MSRGEVGQGQYSTRRQRSLHGRSRTSGARLCRMPLLDLTDAELATAAQASRAMAYQEGSTPSRWRTRPRAGRSSRRRWGMRPWRGSWTSRGKWGARELAQSTCVSAPRFQSNCALSLSASGNLWSLNRLGARTPMPQAQQPAFPLRRHQRSSASTGCDGYGSAGLKPSAGMRSWSA